MIRPTLHRPATRPSIRWLDEPASLNYPAAISYLSLLYRPKEAKAIVKRLEAAEVVDYKAKDIFRASRLSLLGVSNSHVERDKKKIRKGERLSPILLVRDAFHGKVVIADGYHRLCAIYSFDEDAIIRCKICAL
jgi:predicted nucleic acid-binding protein